MDRAATPSLARRDLPDAPRARDAGRLPAALWLALPLAILLVPYGARLAGEATYERLMRTEEGFVEVATALVLLAAVAVGARLAWRGDLLPTRWLRGWYALLTVGCFYFLGEEVSWLDHWFHWGGLERMRELNDQGETNLHNLPGIVGVFLDQLPRNLLTLGAFLGGAVAPIVLRRRRERWPADSAAAYLWPTAICLPAGLLAGIVTLPGKAVEAFDGEMPPALDIRAGESKECFLALFLLVYLGSALARQLRTSRRSAERAAR